MSILFDPPHSATVFVEESVTDSYGNTIRRPSSTGVLIRCMISPMRASRDGDLGGRVEQLFKLIARTAPIGNWSRVEWNNMTSTPDSIMRFDHSPESAHVEVVLRQER